MPRHSETIHVEAGYEAIEAACRRALTALGWETTGSDPGHLSAREDFTTLCCRTSPSQVEISVESEGLHRTAVSIDATAPGIGPIPSPKRLQRQVAALEGRIREAAGS